MFSVFSSFAILFSVGSVPPSRPPIPFLGGDDLASRLSVGSKEPGAGGRGLLGSRSLTRHSGIARFLVTGTSGGLDGLLLLKFRTVAVLRTWGAVAGFLGGHLVSAACFCRLRFGPSGSLDRCVPVLSPRVRELGDPTLFCCVERFRELKVVDSCFLC